MNKSMQEQLREVYLKEYERLLDKFHKAEDEAVLYVDGVWANDPWEVDFCSEAHYRLECYYYFLKEASIID